MDVFDALTSEQPYKKAFTLEKTSEILMDGNNSFFDPLLLDLFMENFDQFVSIKNELIDSPAQEPQLDSQTWLTANL